MFKPEDVIYNPENLENPDSERNYGKWSNTFHFPYSGGYLTLH
jgi:hypothetical protein